MAIDFEKVIKLYALRLSKERVMKCAILSLAAAFFVLLAVDAAIFYSYYRVAVEPASPPETKRTEISQQKLEKALEIIQGRP